MKKKLWVTGLAAVAILAGAQLFQPERTNPPETQAATFEAVANPSPEVTRIVNRACRDCHSHRTVWPWYSRISPVSWLVASDVQEGRARLNFSVWNIYTPEMSQIRLREACGEVRKGEMPPAQYTPLHPNARLSAADIAALCSAAE